MGVKNAAIFIGNSIFGDDRIGLIVGSILREKLEELDFDVHVIESTGFTLLDYLEGYERAVIVDSVCSERNPVGQVLSLSLEAFSSVKSGAPHFSGVPEAVELMRGLGSGLPHVFIVGINVRDPYHLSDEISDELKCTVGAISKEVYVRIRDLARTEIAACNCA